MIAALIIGYALNILILSIAYLKEGHWVFQDINIFDVFVFFIPCGYLLVPLIMLLTKPWREM
jgi:hypothetical protein